MDGYRGVYDVYLYRDHIDVCIPHVRKDVF